jgi:hypothetical protein
VPVGVRVQDVKFWESRPPVRESQQHKLEPATASPSPTASFPALEDNGTAIPPDTQGAVGPNHLVVTLNSQVKIQTRDGASLGAVPLDTFWSNVGTFDPKILYDPYSNRWIFVALGGQKQTTSSILIASASGELTGNLIRYQVKADDTSTLWADYPSVGFNSNWVVVTVNMFDFATPPNFKYAKILVFNKAELYSGGAVALTAFQDASGGFTEVPALTYDSTLPEVYLVTTWNGNNQGAGYIRIGKITVSGGSPVFNPQLAFASTGRPWDNGRSIISFAPQFGSPNLIDAGDDRMLKVVYRNGSLWCSHTVYLPAGTPTHTSVQWWQLGTDGTVLQISRIDDVSGQVFCAYPSIAVNRNNDVVVAYSTFSAQEFASAAYNYRAGVDAPGSLRNGVFLKAGEDPYYLPDPTKSNKNRWGDYSNSVVDPLNDFDIWTIQEYAASPSNNWGTWWGKIVPDETPQQGSVPVITSLSARLSGDVLTLTGTATDPTGDMAQTDVAFLNAGGNVVADTQPFQYAFGSAAVTNFTINIIHMSSVPDAVVARLTVIDKQGFQSVPVAADFNQPDPGAPTISNAGYDFDNEILTIRGPGFGDQLQLEVNGVVVAPPLHIKIKGGGAKLKIVGTVGDLNLRSGPNRIVIVGSGLRSNIFVLSL